MTDKRLIDANALKSKIDYFDCHECGYECNIEFVSADDLEAAHTIDAVEVVRCGQCNRATKFYDSEFGEVVFCNEHHGFTDECGFCHKGKKKEAST